MMRSKLYEFGKTIAHWFAQALQLQLFLTLLSLPILAIWGLPFSLMSPLGNIIFTPFLIVFLLLSSCMFFAELLHLPYGLCAQLLDQLTALWTKIMDCGARTWLTGVSHIPFLYILCIAIAPFFIMSCKHTKSLLRSIVCFVCIFAGMVGYIKLSPPPHSISSIACARGELTLITTPTCTILVDPGYLGSMTNAASWAHYTLIPELIKMGITTIDHVIVLQPKGFAFEALEQLCCFLCIEKIWLPFWSGTMKASHCLRYKKLIKVLPTTKTQLLRIKDVQEIRIGNVDHLLTITKTPRNITVGGITYSAFICSAQIDNKKVTLYSSN